MGIRAAAAGELARPLERRQRVGEMLVHAVAVGRRQPPQKKLEELKGRLRRLLEQTQDPWLVESAR
jgi:hypothetical protein